MKKKYGKLLAVVLAIVMVVSLLPISALADNIASNEPSGPFTVTLASDEASVKTEVNANEEGDCVFSAEAYDNLVNELKAYYDCDVDVVVTNADAAFVIGEGVTLEADLDLAADVTEIESSSGTDPPVDPGIVIPDPVVPDPAINGGGEEVLDGPDAVTHTVTYHYPDGETATEGVLSGGQATARSLNPADYDCVNFRGWSTSAEEELLYDFNTAVTGDFDLYAVVTNTYLIHYTDQDGKIIQSDVLDPGARIYGPTQDTLNLITPPGGTRLAHWYVDGDESQTPFYFNAEALASSDLKLRPCFTSSLVVVFNSDGGTPITADTLLTAKWNPRNNVNYTVAIWMEAAGNAADFVPTAGNQSQYKYLASVNLTGTAGAMTNLDINNLPDSIKRYFNGTVTGSILKYGQPQFVESREIQGNGLTVINLYATRKVYTYNFKLAANNSSRTMQIGTTTYTGANNATQYSIGAKYEMDISAIFPVQGVEFATFSDGFKSWARGDSMKWQDTANIASIRRLLDAGFISENGQQMSYTVTASWDSSGSSYLYRYFVEQLPEQVDDTTLTRINRDGTVYVLMTEYNQSYQGGLNAKTINGLSRVSENHTTYYPSTDGTWTTTPQYTCGRDEHSHGTECCSGWYHGPFHNCNTDDCAYGYEHRHDSSCGIYRCFFYTRTSQPLTFNMMLPGGEQAQNAPASPQTLKFEQPLTNYEPAAEPTVASGNYTFAGWYHDAAYNQPFNWDVTMPIGGMIAYARWESTDNTLTFLDARGGTEQWTQGVAGGSSAINKNEYWQPEQFVEGYGEFQGWYYDISGIPVKWNWDSTVHTDYTLYATWVTSGFKVTYDLDGGTGIPTPVDANSYNINTKAKVLDGEGAEKDSKVFYAWKDMVSGELYYAGSYIDISTTGDITLVAQYANADDLYTVTYYATDENGAVKREYVLKDAADEYKLAGEIFTDNGNRLIGWSTTAGGEKEYELGEAYPISGNTSVFYGVWDAAAVKVTFYPGDHGTITDQSVFTDIAPGTEWQNAGITVPGVNPEPGYYFTGWDPVLPAEDAAINSDMDFVAQYAAVTPIVLTAKSDEFMYDGTLKSVYGFTGAPAGLTFFHLNGTTELDAEATGTEAGTYPANFNMAASAVRVYRGGEDVTHEYSVRLVPGELEITKNTTPITITARDASKQYDGTPLTQPLYDTSTLPTGFTVANVVMTADSTITNVGTQPNVIDTFELRYGGVAVDWEKNFSNVKKVNGELEITKNNTLITITALSASKQYDGDPLTEPGYNAVTTLSGLDITATVVGTITDIGSVPNVVKSHKIVQNGVDVTANYTNVVYVDGTLKITNNVAITINARSDSKPYDGTALTNSGVDVTGLDEGIYRVDAVVSGSQIDAGASINELVSFQIIRRSDSADMTEFFDNGNLTTNDGTLTVTKRALTITADSADKVYDNTPLTTAADAWRITNGTLPADVNGTPFVLTATVAGSRTNAGSSDNKITGYNVALGTNSNVTGNFEITTVDGTLRVDPLTVTVTANDEQFTYTEVAGVPQSFSATAPGFTYVDNNGATDGVLTGVSVSGSITFPWEVITNSVDLAPGQVFYQGLPIDGTNVKLVPVDGELTMIAPQGGIPWTVTGASGGGVYKGSSYDVDGYTHTLGAGFTVSGISATASRTNVGSTPVVPQVGNEIVIKHGSTDVTNYFAAPNMVAGSVDVSKLTVTMTAHDSLGNLFTGAVYKVNTYATAPALAGNDTLSGLAAYGEQQAPGSSGVRFRNDGSTSFNLYENGITRALTFNAEAQTLTGATNYDFVLVPGTVEVVMPAAGSLNWALAGDVINETYDGTNYATNGVAATWPTLTGGSFSYDGVVVTDVNRTNVNDTERATNTTPVTETQTIDATNAVITYTDVNDVEHDATSWFAAPTVTPGSVTINAKNVDVTLTIAPLTVKQNEGVTATIGYNAFITGQNETNALYAQSGVNWGAFNQSGNNAKGDYQVVLTKSAAYWGNYSFTYTPGNLGVEGGHTITVRDAGSVVYHANGVGVDPADIPTDSTEYYEGDTANVNAEDDLTTGNWTFLGWAKEADAETPDYAYVSGGTTYEDALEFIEDGQTIDLYAVWKYEFDNKIEPGEDEEDANWDVDTLTVPYDGKAHGLTISGDTYDDASIVVNGASELAAMPTYKNVGTYVHEVILTKTLQTADGGTRTFTTTLSGTLIIKKVDLTITAPDATATYGDLSVVYNPNAYSVNGLVTGENLKTVLGLGENEDLVYGTSYTTTTNAGTYPVFFKDGENEITNPATQTVYTATNYNVILVNGTLTVTKGTVVIEGLRVTADADELEKVYDGTALTFKKSMVQLRASNGTVVPAADYDLFYSRDGGATWTAFAANGDGPSITDVGTDNFKLKAEVKASSTNFKGSAEAASSLKVTHAPLTITADNKDVTFGMAAPDLTATIGTGLASRDSDLANTNFAAYLEIYEPYVAGDPAGTVRDIRFTADKQTALRAIFKNYNVILEDGKLTVQTLTIDVEDEEEPVTPSDYSVYMKVQDEEKMYASQDGTFTFDAESIARLKGLSDYIAQNFDTLFDFEFTRERENTQAGENVGNYAISGMPVSLNDNNIVITGKSEDGNLEITQRPVTITPNPASKGHGENDPALTATESFTQGNPSSWTGFTPDDLVYTVERADGSDVGSYRLDVVYTSDENLNYRISTDYLPGRNETDDENKFIITPTGTLVINIGSQSKTYGFGDPGAPSINVSGLKTGDSAANLNLSVTRQPGQNAGAYQWVVNYTKFSNNYENYVVNQGNFTINPRTVVLVANDETITEGDDMPTFSYYMADGYSLASWDTGLNLYIARISGLTTAGTYANDITIYNGGNQNYDIRTVPGTLTINAADTPVVPLVVVPAAPVVPAGPAPVVAVDAPVVPEGAPVTEIEPQEAPATQAPVELEEEPTPQAAAPAYWALLNLIIAILALLLAIVLIVGIFSRRKKGEETEEQAKARQQRIDNGEEVDDEENKGKTGLAWRILAVIAGIASPIVFFLTENIRNPMTFVDN